MAINDVPNIKENKMKKTKFMENLEKGQEIKEGQFQESVLFLDLETGADVNGEVSTIRKNKIRQEILGEKYQDHAGYGDKKNRERALEFDSKKQARIASAVTKMNEKDAVNPFFNRICILGMAIPDKNGLEYFQFTELESTQEELVEIFCERVQGKKLVSYNGNGFDIPTLKTKAAKHGIVFPYIQSVDIFDKFKIWSPFGGPPMMAGQDIFSAVLGVERNKYENQVNKEIIGSTFEQAKQGITDLIKTEIETILKYNLEDLRVLSEIYFKLKFSELL
jgi:uncharacterized protein YprB with RNaseH-like and TPR domain